MNKEKEQAAPSSEINLKVKDQSGSLLCFKLKRTTKLKKLMETYCSRQGFPLSSVRFLYESESLKETDTPESLKMEENDEIDALIEQHGGAF